MHVPRRSVVAAALGGAMLAAGGSAPGAGRELPAVSGGEHAWFVVESQRQPGTIELCHHAPGIGEPHFKSLMNLNSTPEAMAAWGDRIWLVFPVDPQAERPRREVFTVQVHKDANTGWYHPVPRDRLEVVEPLTALGKLEGFVGTADGPVALFWPNQWASAGVHASESSMASERALDQPLLLHLRGEQWRERGLPGGLPAAAAGWLAAGGADGLALRLLADADHQPGRTLSWQWDPVSRQWQTGEIPLDFRRVHSAHLVGGRPLLSLTDSRDAGKIEIAYLRRDGLLPLAELSVPKGDWALLGMADGLRLLEQDRAGGLSIGRMDPVTGEIPVSETMRPPTVAAGGMLQMAFLLAVLAAALVLVFLARPALRRPVEVPKGLSVLPIGPRLGALAIDLAAGGVPAVLILGCPMAALLRLPMWTPDIADGVPFLIMAGIMVFHTTVSELIWGTTLGKAIVGARVVSIMGSRPAWRQVLLRNLVKCVILLMPPLGVFMMLNHNLQGLGDLLARTLVVRPVKE